MASAVGLDNSDFYFITFYCSLQNDYVIMAQFNTVHSLLYIYIESYHPENLQLSRSFFHRSILICGQYKDNALPLCATLLPSKVNHFTTLITIYAVSI